MDKMIKRAGQAGPGRNFSAMHSSTPKKQALPDQGPAAAQLMDFIGPGRVLISTEHAKFEV